ncbi:hypothetical protein M407DRAFT_6995 [Tulasnella calospora MUT 4182]|uniref:F-box domain-containing protein n=1 Tax=Tulasnella calospora MUT 4182 TaxID=1051891 RepID=A0A0C3M2P7_9AGAM|nr:hypothetical protein M407DRAFT_6995 [Tulasnella calospora MUT 4182]
MQLSNCTPSYEVIREERWRLGTGGAGTERKPTMEQLDAQLAEMEHSPHDLLLKSYQIKRERNALVPFHRLPGEIFVAILLKVAKYNEPGFDQEHQRLHTLAQVSTYWFDTILAFSSFWYQLAQYHPPYFREWVLKRNTSGLFNIDCVLAQGETGPVGERLLLFMKMAAPFSERWKLLAFEGDLTDEMMELLRSPAPNLDSMLISSWDTIGVASRMLELGEGSNIQYLDIDNITVPWNSSRLQGLRAVQIQHVSGMLPSLAELHAMLATSPELWWLQLSGWSPFDDGVALASEASGIQIKPIGLPVLTSLILHNLPAAVTEFLLSSIIAPSCQCVIVREVPSALLNSRAACNTLVDLMNGALKAISRLRMSCRRNGGPLHLLSDPSRGITYNWIHHVDELPGLNVQIPTRGLSTSQLGSFLSLLNFPDKVDLTTDVNGVDLTTDVNGVSWAPSLMSVGWHRVPNLEVTSVLAVETICEQLANLPPPSACQSRLQSFSSPLYSDRTHPGVYDSIVRNLVAYVQRRQARKDTEQQVNDGPDGEVNRRDLEIQLPRTILQKLRRPLRDWNVRLSEFGQGSGQSVNEGMPDSSFLPDNMESLVLNG